jgi:ribulose-phosphate 3-epimerase
MGYHGQEVDPIVFEKIRELRAKFPNIPISGDGGVTIDNAHEWVKAGATRLVSGSAIYQSDNISETIDELRILDEKIKQGLV